MLEGKGVKHTSPSQTQHLSSLGVSLLEHVSHRVEVTSDLTEEAGPSVIHNNLDNIRTISPFGFY